MNKFLFPLLLSSISIDKWQLYKSFFENAPYPLTVVEENGLISYANKEFCNLVGYKLHEIIGEHFIKFVAPEDRKRLEKYHERRMKGMDAPSQYEYKALTKDGKIKHIRIKVIKLPENRTISCKIDLTEEKKARKELEESEEKFKAIFANARDGIFIETIDGEIIDVNDAGARILGYEKEELIGKNVKDIVPDYIEDRLPEIKEMIKKDGSIVPVEISASFVTLGGKEYVVAIVRDITERKKIEDELKKERELFKMVTEKSIVGIYVIQDGVFKYVNPKLAEIFGYKVEELINRKGPLDLTFEEDRPIVQKNIRKRLEGKIESIHYEFRGVRKDGKIINVEVYGSRFMYDNKPAIVGTLLDITAKKRIERELKDSEEKYRTLVETLSDGIISIDEEGKIIFWNKAAEEIFGYSQKEVIGKPITMIMPEWYKEKHKKAFKKFLERGKKLKRTLEVEGLRKNGEIFPVELSFSAYKRDHVFTFIAIARDITERKRIERELKDNEEKYRTLVELMQEGIAVDDEKENMIFVNDAFARMLGYEKDELIGKNVFDIVAERDKEKLMEECKKRRKGKASKYEIHFITKNGNIKTAIVSAIPLYKNGKFIGSISVNLDITERKKAEEKLAESEALFRAIIQYSSAGMFIMQNDKIKLVNPAFLRNVGYSEEEIKKMNYLELIYEEDREKVSNVIKKVMNGEETDIPEFRYVTKDGKIRWGVGSGVPIEYKEKPAFLGTITDVTEIRKTYEMKKEFMESIAHYFFNPIAIAKGYLELAIEKDGESKDMLKKVNEAIGRIEKVVENIVRKGEIYE